MRRDARDGCSHHAHADGTLRVTEKQRKGKDNAARSRQVPKCQGFESRQLDVRFTAADTGWEAGRRSKQPDGALQSTKGWPAAGEIARNALAGPAFTTQPGLETGPCSAWAANAWPQDTWASCMLPSTLACQVDGHIGVIDGPESCPFICIRATDALGDLGRSFSARTKRPAPVISMLCRVLAWTCQRATNRFLTSRRRPRARMAWVIGYSSCDIGLSKLHHARFVADAADATTHGDTNLKSRLNQHYDSMEQPVSSRRDWTSQPYCEAAMVKT
ncbi:hypothetical protein Purlil1_8981 [Purpureocillium lilacinum]|uniref:Uncharacterized protein n=1 Tax=Purpureocillium lilacinum TaxID=33203 RepID=A0ABR0BRD1_PURLI|nr:hypothetical protein Purlil1_8981 [Purpureocillium lilacinum]